MTKPAAHWTPAELREIVADRSGRRCEWPNGSGGGVCGDPMAELAHITSRGMGGGTTRNRPSNVFAACSSHARISDLLPPPGGTAADVYDQIRLVPGCGDVKPGDRIGARLAAGLTVWVASITFGAE